AGGFRRAHAGGARGSERVPPRRLRLARPAHRRAATGGTRAFLPEPGPGRYGLRAGLSATPAHIWPGAFASMAMAGRPKSSVLAASDKIASGWRRSASIKSVRPRDVRDARVMRQGPGPFRRGFR